MVPKKIVRILLQFRGREEYWVETITAMKEQSIGQRAKGAVRKSAKKSASWNGTKKSLPPSSPKVAAAFGAAAMVSAADGSGSCSREGFSSDPFGVRLVESSGINLHARAALAFLLLAATAQISQGQRDQTRCFDVHHFPSCDVETAHLENTGDTCNDLGRAQDVCHRLMKDSFQMKRSTALDISQHHSFFKNLLETDPLCQDIRQCYRKCVWCADESFLEKRVKRQRPKNPVCFPETIYFPSPPYRCDPPPGNDGAITSENGEQRLDETCQLLEHMYSRDEYPATTELCTNQFSIYHQCPNLCPSADQRCFDFDDPVDAVVDPPSCEAYVPGIDEQKKGTTSMSINITATCQKITDFHLGFWYSRRYEYHSKMLGTISRDSPFCYAAKIAYPQCEWCTSMSCFKRTPPSCDQGDNEDNGSSLLPQQQQVLCDETVDSMKAVIELIRPGTNPHYPMIHTISKSSKLQGNFSECNNYSKAYPTCIWCTQDFCFDDANPPSCDIADVTSNGSLPFDVQMGSDVGFDIDSMCQDMFDHFYIPKDSELDFWRNSTDLFYYQMVSRNSDTCRNMHQYMHLCPWCNNSTNFCFDDDNPPSCDLSLTNAIEVKTDVEHACQEILPLLPRKRDHPTLFWNSTKHVPFLRRIQGNSSWCTQAREAYAHCYWCVRYQQNKGEIDEKVNTTTLCSPGYCHIPETAIPGDPAVLATCVELKAISEEQGLAFPKITTSDLCIRAALTSAECDEVFCRSGLAYPVDEKKRTYLGASTENQKKALQWTSRASAMLSFCGSTFILVDIISNKKKRRTVFHGLLIGMAIFDIVTAVAWSFASSAIDPHDASWIYGAAGSKASCTAQGFFVQLGFTSIFYNVSLTLYYTLVISKGWREFQLRKIRLYMHLTPFLVGAGLALGGLTSYHWIEYGCHIQPFDKGQEGGELWQVLVFIVIPLGLSIISITCSMAAVYFGVFKVTQKAKKWGASSSERMRKEVFWQCCWYVLAFYVTWPIMFCVYLTSIDVGGPYGLAVTVAFVAPLQGFSNFLVYVRPKVKTYYQDILKRRAKRARQKKIDAEQAARTTGTSSVCKGSFDSSYPFVEKKSVLHDIRKHRHVDEPERSQGSPEEDLQKAKAEEEKCEDCNYMESPAQRGHVEDSSEVAEDPCLTAVRSGEAKEGTSEGLKEAEMEDMDPAEMLAAADTIQESTGRVEENGNSYVQL